jgi:hypothetical protein
MSHPPLQRLLDVATTGLFKCYLARARFATGGGGLISAILRRQSASEECGPETNVPLTFVLYQPEVTPSRSASSDLTWRGVRNCMISTFR